MGCHEVTTLDASGVGFEKAQPLPAAERGVKMTTLHSVLAAYDIEPESSRRTPGTASCPFSVTYRRRCERTSTAAV
jgi:hypothetical protein